VRNQQNTVAKANLFQDLPAAIPIEVFEPIVNGKGLTLERIISQGQATPDGEWLVQERDEWVLLVSGKARLLFEHEEGLLLEPGDYVHIPAATKHRVQWTDPEKKTIWLALHYEATEKSMPGSSPVEKVKVVRSNRRKRTAGARLIGGTMYLYVPGKMSEKEVGTITERFTKHFEKVLLKKKLNSEKSLRQVAEELNTKYFNGALEIDSIQYVTNQTHKFGCCSIQSRSIRISDTIASMPDWVRDYVVMHEICHLKEAGHGKAFWDLVNRYPLVERAKGFLLAKGLELNAEDRF
jgi:cupin 2 domain-containing protein